MHLQSASVSAPISPANRRTSQRLPIRVLVEYENREDFCNDYTANMAIGGMFIKTDTPLELGTRFRLRFQVPGRERPIDTLAVVRWSIEPSAAGPLHPGMGIRFDDLSAADEAAVQRMLDTYED